MIIKKILKQTETIKQINNLESFIIPETYLK